MQNINDIINNNSKLTRDITNKNLKDLPAIILDNINKPVINIYDSGYIAYATSFTSTIKTNVKNELIPAYANISAQITLDLPDYLIPFLNTNIMIQGNNGTVASGVVPYKSKTLTHWLDAYFDGNLVFAGVAKEAEATTASTAFIIEPHRKDSDEYTTISNPWNVWTIDVNWDEGGYSRRMRGATIVQVVPKLYNYSYTNLGGSPELREYAMDLMWESFISPVYQLNMVSPTLVQKTSCMASEVLSVDTTNITIRMQESHLRFQENSSGVVFENGSYYTNNVVRNFSLNDCLLILVGQQEVLYNEAWYPVFRTADYNSNAMEIYGAGWRSAMETHYANLFTPSSLNANTQTSIVYSNPQLMGYVPCWDSRKLLWITYIPGRTQIQKFLTNFSYRASFWGPGYGQKGPLNFLNNVADVCDVREMFQDYSSKLYRTVLDYHSGYPAVKTIPRIYPDSVDNSIYYDSLTETYILSGYKNTNIFKNEEGNYVLDLDAKVIVKCPAIKQSNETFTKLDNVYTQTYPSTGNPIAFSFAEVSSSTTDEQIWYVAESSDILVKITVDLVNPFYYSEEKKINQI